MKLVYHLFLLLFFAHCTPAGKTRPDVYSASLNEDTRIISRVLEQLAGEKDAPSGELMVKVGSYFLETPYVANTLETQGSERLIINLREMDCTTFAENCLALTRTLQSKKPGLNQFVAELTRIRYRDAQVEDYASRLHYTSDWIYNNQQKKEVQDVTKNIGGVPYKKTINFMSMHPDSYKHLKNNPVMVAKMVRIETTISGRSYYYIPKERLTNYESQLQDGDIVALTTRIDGLDVSHMGILKRHNNRIHLLHASSAEKKVVLSKEPLENYLKHSKYVTGIMVARPL